MCGGDEEMGAGKGDGIGNGRPGALSWRSGDLVPGFCNAEASFQRWRERGRMGFRFVALKIGCGPQTAFPSDSPVP